jgi:hypothetical protein
LEQCIDFRRYYRDPELFTIVLALHHIRALIERGGTDIGRPSDYWVPHQSPGSVPCSRSGKGVERPACCAGIAPHTASAPTSERSMRKDNLCSRRNLTGRKVIKSRWNTSQLSILPSTATPVCLPPVPIPATRRSGTGQSMGICCCSGNVSS